MKRLGIKLHRWLTIHYPCKDSFVTRCFDWLMDWLEDHGCEPPENDALRKLIDHLIPND